MAKTFVVINDPVHRLLRNLTRQAPLCPCSGSGGLPAIKYHVQPGDLPEAYYALAFFHALQGLSLDAALSLRWRVQAADKPAVPQRAGFFDALRLDRRCCRDLRLKPGKEDPGMLAAELICFGTGMLRARHDNPAGPAQRLLWSSYGRLHTPREVVFARIHALHWNSWLLDRRAQKEAFDSTNLIYGDAMGELEQLWERRADTVFLEQVVRHLQPLRRRAEIGASLQPPLNLRMVIKLHLRAQALWRTPPISARALLHRLDYLLEHTTIENAPATSFAPPDPRPCPEPDLQRSNAAGWETDRSGYDGWLPGSDPGPLDLF